MEYVKTGSEKARELGYKAAKLAEIICDAGEGEVLDTAVFLLYIVSKRQGVPMERVVFALGEYDRLNNHAWLDAT